jgi:type IV pilus assembly protein PilC
MQQFVYTAKDPTGRVVKAEVEAASAADATKLLLARELFPLSVTPRVTTGLQSINLESLRRITAKDKVVFTRQLATLVKAGLPIARALSVLNAQIDNPKMLRVAQAISTDVQGGTSLSQSLARHPEVFSPIYISMVEAGEASGNLDETLLRLASQEEKTAALMSKIRGAFTYPAIVFAVLIGVMILMITMVLPQVGQMYIDLKKPLPLTTKILLGIAAIFTKFWYLFVLAGLFAAYALRVYLKTPEGRKRFDQLKLNIPVFDTLVKKMYMARFTRTLGSLVASGVPILQALEISAKSMNNVHLQKAIKEVASKVKGGTAMSKPLSDHPLFLPLVGQMISVGEQTGTIGDSLEKVANYYEEEVDQAVKNISTLIEPATMVVLGGMVAFLIGAVLLPIYGLVSAIR